MQQRQRETFEEQIRRRAAEAAANDATDLSRTGRALDVWEAHQERVDGLATDAQVERWLDENDRLALEVGEAFAADTAAFNHPEVATLVVPTLPVNREFIGRQVRRWRARVADERLAEHCAGRGTPWVEQPSDEAQLALGGR